MRGGTEKLLLDKPPTQKIESTVLTQKTFIKPPDFKKVNDMIIAGKLSTTFVEGLRDVDGYSKTETAKYLKRQFGLSDVDLDLNGRGVIVKPSAYPLIIGRERENLLEASFQPREGLTWSDSEDLPEDRNITDFEIIENFQIETDELFQRYRLEALRRRRYDSDRPDGELLTLLESSQRAANIKLPNREKLGNRFLVYGMLGEGGFGKAFLAEQVIIGRLDVLKVVDLTEFPGNEKQVFQREIKALAAIDHPHVLKIRHAEFAEDQGVIVTEFIEGQNLNTSIENNERIEVFGNGQKKGVVDIIHDIASALQALHEHKDGKGRLEPIIHRDVKPSNIFVDNNGRIILGDFGLARGMYETEIQQFGLPSDAKPEKTKITEDGIVQGTLCFVAPELFSGQPFVSPKADIYALGLVAWEVFVGALPFRDENDSAMVMRDIVSRDIPSLAERRPDLPPKLIALVDLMLSKNPAQRPTAHEVVIFTKYLKNQQQNP